MPILLFIKKTYLVFISLLGFIFLFAACQDEWDLPEVSFPEIITLEKLEMNGPPTEMTVYGEIKGLKDAESSVDEHGHILKLAGNGGPLDLEGNYEKRVQRQRKGNGTYTSLITGLTPDSIYIYRAYAIFNGKVYYGEIRGFMAGSVGSMLEVTNVEILIKSPTASAIRVDCQIEGLPEKMEITDYGIALVHLSTPEDTTIPDLITGNIYSQGAIPKTEPTAVFSIPVSPLLPGYYRVRAYFEVNGALFYSDPHSFAIGDFWEKGVEIPYLGTQSVSTLRGNRAYILFYSQYPDDDVIVNCVNVPSFWSYDVQETWMNWPNTIYCNPGGTVFSLGDTLYACMGTNLGGYSELNNELLKLHLEDGGYASVTVVDNPFDRGPRRAYGVSFTLGNKAYVGLGLDSSAQAVADFWEFNPASTTPWTQLADFPGGALAGAVTFTLGDKVYVGLGERSDGTKNTNFWAFDGNSWADNIAPFPGEGRVEAEAFALYGRGYVGWGISNATYDYVWCQVYTLDVPFTDLWMYDPNTGPLGTWSQKHSFPGVRRENLTTFGLDGIGYAGLGHTGTITFSDFYQYYPD